MSRWRESETLIVLWELEKTASTFAKQPVTRLLCTTKLRIHGKVAGVWVGLSNVLIAEWIVYTWPVAHMGSQQRQLIDRKFSTAYVGLQITIADVCIGRSTRGVSYCNILRPTGTCYRPHISYISWPIAATKFNTNYQASTSREV